mgnify:CR=1 FL=1
MIVRSVSLVRGAGGVGGGPPTGLCSLVVLPKIYGYTGRFCLSRVRKYAYVPSGYSGVKQNLPL